MSPRSGGEIRLAAVDCGTNSIRLLVVEASVLAHGDRGGAGAHCRELERRSGVVRLGEGVDATGELAPAALRRVRERCAELAARCADLGVTAVRFVATSAARDVRDASPLAEVVESAFAAWGTRLEVLSGRQEAEATFRGAVEGLAAQDGGPWLVVDIGGGSTELVRGSWDAATGLVVQAACSLDIGAVRLHERLGLHDPPTSDDVARVRAVVEPAVTAALAEVPLDGVRTLVGVSGTATTVAAHEQRLARRDADVALPHRSTPKRERAAALDLVGMTVDRRAALPDMVPGREDVIGAGALVWAVLLERAAAAGVRRVVVSEHDLLDGLVVGLAAARERRR